MTAAAAEHHERVGPYRVIRAIGAGGSARIDLARIDRAYGFQRHVVIKRPLEHLRDNPRVTASLRREARIGGLLRHPNLVAILDAGVHDGYDYLALEYVHGAALRTVMQSEAPGQVRELPLAVALAIVCDVARGMHEAHELTDDRGSPLGLVHRDVSPGNILIGFDGSVKLADFGIAKETRVSTLSGSLHGTVTYMAPEQCQGHAFDRRADVFSLGVILYELVTGTRLFWADNDVASLHRVLSGSVPRPRRIKPQLTGALEDIVMTAVAHEPDRRYPTALELATALERHAASAGEVLGARWIARAMETIVGPRQAPWIATAAAREPAPRSDGSLVELIAAAGSEEPIESSFGDAGDVVAAEEAAAAPVQPAVAPLRDRRARRARRLVAGLVAIAVIGGSAAAAVILTRGSDPPPAGSAATLAAPGPALEAPGAPREARPSPEPPAAQPAPPEPPAAQPAPPEPPTAQLAPPEPPRVQLAPPEPPRVPARAPVATGTGTVAKKRRRLPPSARPAASAAVPSATTPSPAEPRSSVDAGDTAAPSAGASAPPVKPPSNVQWRPTLLLPTDGSAARPPR